MTILDQILKIKKEEVTDRKRKISERDLMITLFAKRKRLSMRKALEDSSLGIIAEFKRRSPSKGDIAGQALVADIVEGYALNGASACSVLTDATYFGGSLLDLALARKVVDIPLLRKDFIIDTYQIAEAAANGADAVLLIAAALSEGQCKEYVEVAHAYGLEVLLEVHKMDELRYIFPEVDMIGVNNRNLETFVTDITTSFDLIQAIPEEFLKVAESGITSRKTIDSLRQAGFRGFLIGERLMREKHPALALKNFIENVS